MRLRNFILLLSIFCLPLLSSACGTDPLAGLEGEFCEVDVDCEAGLVCERRVCQALAGEQPDEVPEQRGEFFAGLRLQDYTGDQDTQQLRQFGQFLADLSRARFPYWVADAPTGGQVTFGRANLGTEPVSIDSAQSASTIAMSEVSEGNYAAQGDVSIDVDFSDESVALNFVIPLRSAQLTMDFSAEPLHEATGTLSGVLRSVDAENIQIVPANDAPFTLFQLIRNEPMTVDSDGDGINDAWSLGWSLTAEWI